jgi:hypothetical protein
MPTLTATSAITRAYRHAGILSDVAAPSATQLAEALETLNALCLAWRKFGLTTWARAPITFSLVLGQATYTFGSSGSAGTVRPVRIFPEGSYITQDGMDSPLTLVPRSDYYGLGDKASAGTPVQFWYDQGVSLGTVVVWPVPDSAGMTVTLDCQVPMTAVTSSDSLDIPEEWQEAVALNLALRLSLGRTRVSANLKELAKEAFESAMSTGTEDGSIRFEPAGDDE